MFALLEHAVGDETHWDLLVESRGSDGLKTWRLRQNPLTCAGPIVAEPLGDHRRVYLDFEGEISGGRGSVRRLDRGEAELDAGAAGVTVIRLRGTHLTGEFEISSGAAAVMRRTRPAAAPNV